MRARDLGIAIGTGTPGPLNAITDVPGVRVGMTTLIVGADVRTGVTVIVPDTLPLFAGSHRLNGNGELTGLEYVRENGMLTTPLAITNTHSVGVVRDALVAARRGHDADDGWSLPVVGETWDGWLNDISRSLASCASAVTGWSSANWSSPCVVCGTPGITIVFCAIG